VALTEEIDAWLTHRPRTSDDSAPSDAHASQSQPFRSRILLVDADEGLLVALGARLSDQGHAVRTARDGFEALALMRAGTPDLLISDLKMPNMSGFELLSIVRQRFPVVAVIAYTGEFVLAGTPSILCDRIIAKRRNSNFEVVDAIRELLAQSPLRTQPAKFMPAPAWIPRLINGYFVLTCRDCLRSFSVLTRDGAIGEDAIAKCDYCGADVNYHIDASLLPIKDDVAELMRRSRERLDSMRSMVQRSRQKRETIVQIQRSLKKSQNERNARAASRQNRPPRRPKSER
jgi:CheY-like chemotaxis protein